MLYITISEKYLVAIFNALDPVDQDMGAAVNRTIEAMENEA